MSQVSVACFGLQGFGNDLLRSLQSVERADVTVIHTREAAYPFGYYPCESIEAAAGRIGVPVHVVPSKGSWDCDSADLAIISSFHRILEKKHLDRFHRVINIHPSLLPEYKGATPTNWMVRNAEQIVGLTAHQVDEGIDTGPILFQRRVLNPYLNDHQLRKALSFLTRDLIAEIVGRFPNYEKMSISGSGSRHVARTEADAIARVDDFNSIEELIHHIKAFTNYPMPKIDIDGGIFVVDYEDPVESIQIELAGESCRLLGYWQAS